MAPMLYKRGGSWHTMRLENPPPAPTDRQKQLRLDLVGSVVDLFGWSEINPDWHLAAWLDHWYKGKPVWGLRYTTGPVALNLELPVYSLSAGSVQAKRFYAGDMNTRPAELDVSLPVYGFYHTFWATGSGKPVTLPPTGGPGTHAPIPEILPYGGSASSNNNGWGYMWKDDLAAGPIPGGGTFFGVAQKLVAPTGPIAAGLGALRGTLNADLNYHRKPGVTDADLIVV